MANINSLIILHIGANDNYHVHIIFIIFIHTNEMYPLFKLRLFSLLGSLLFHAVVSGSVCCLAINLVRACDAFECVCVCVLGRKWVLFICEKASVC